MKKMVSIIIPVYNEQENLIPLWDALCKSTKEIEMDFEFIFIDDGSKDSSINVLDDIKNANKNVRVIQFSRNFGKEAAISAGLHESRGDAALMIDSDMQMPPEKISEFIEKWQNGAEVVVGVFTSRNMSWTRRNGARLFYKIMQLISQTKITPHATDFRLIDRQVIDAFNGLTERNRISRGIIDWLGFKRDYINFEQSVRLNGSPNYSLNQLVILAINSFTSYSLLPLRLSGYLGLFIILISFPFGIFLYIMRFVFGNPFNWAINGITFLSILIMALVGLVLVSLGLISLYIGQIHSETANRPLYIKRNSIKLKKTGE